MRVLVVGAGPFGLTAARLLHDSGETVEVIDRRDHIGGNAADREQEGVRVHRYGMHIFHTSDELVWNFVNRFSEWTPYEHHVWVDTRAGIYPLPFGLALYHQLYGITQPERLRGMARVWAMAPHGDDLESWARTQIGERAYDLIVKPYTEKQWGRPCAELPSSILKRLPIRSNWDTRYFNDRYQAMPSAGYETLWRNLAKGLTITVGTDFLSDRAYWESRADRIIWTGALDQLWGYELGELEYRSLRFEEGPSEEQGCPVLNNARTDNPWTRTYDWTQLPSSEASRKAGITTREFPAPYERGGEAYYPVRTRDSITRAHGYLVRTRQDGRYWLGGRLGTFRYYDMHQAIRAAMTLVVQMKSGARAENNTLDLIDGLG